MSPPTVPSPMFLLAFFDDTALILGEENISRTPDTGALKGLQNQESYGDPFSATSSKRPSGAVRPANVEQVQGIVKLANRHKVHLWTVSRGKNLGYGGSSSVVNDSVVLDLHRMNKIIELNERPSASAPVTGVLGTNRNMDFESGLFWNWLSQLGTGQLVKPRCRGLILPALS